MVTKPATVALEALERQVLSKLQDAIESLALKIKEGGEYSERTAKGLAIRIILRYITQVFLPDPPANLIDEWDAPLHESSFLSNEIRRIIGETLVGPEYTFREFLYSDAQVAIDPSFLGKVVEVTQTGADREARGIFFTPRIEIELMCKLVLMQYFSRQAGVPLDKVAQILFAGNNKESEGAPGTIQNSLGDTEAEALEETLRGLRILDPACGTGAFILGILHELVQLHIVLSEYLGHPESLAEIKTYVILNNLYGIDVNSVAIQVTKTRLAIALLCEQEDNGDIFPRDDLSAVLASHLRVGDSIAESDSFFSDDFDIVIGNPPYVQHTRIAPPQVVHPTKTQKLAYIRQIQDVARNDWNNLVNFRGQVDYLVYFFLKGLKLLKPGGLLCFISSSTWLDAELGLDFKVFLVQNIQILQFFDTNAEKSFQSANINTIISLFQKPAMNADLVSNFAQFILYKVPFQDYFNASAMALVASTRANRDEDWVKVTLVAQPDLLPPHERAGSREIRGLGNRWGMRYLKYFGPVAPLLDASDVRQNYIPLATLAIIKRGFTSGANGFFYLSRRQWRQWEIEAEFLAPLLKSPRELTMIRVGADTALSYRVFSCRKPKADLLGTNALRYIEEYGETAEVKLKGKKVVGFHNTATCLARPVWYALSSHRSAPIVIQKGFADSFAVYENAGRFLVDQTFYEIIPHKKAYIEPLLAVMNSTFAIFELLRISTTGLGGGLYRPTVNEIRTLTLPDIHKMPTIRLPATMKERPIHDIYEECGLDPARSFAAQTPTPLPDREALDLQVVDFLGLSRTILPDLYRSVCELIRNRLAKATRKVLPS